MSDTVERVAAAIANARAARKGAPPVSNVLELIRTVAISGIYEELIADAEAAIAAMSPWRPIAEMPPELKNGRGLMLYGRHATTAPHAGGFVKGDHWWAIAAWNIWREANRERWVYALNGEPLSWGEPTHYCELKAP